MYRFMVDAGFESYRDLHQWSITAPPEFWSALCSFASLRFSRPPVTILSAGADIRTAVWFDGARLNYAEHLLFESSDRIALIGADESGRRRHLSFAELQQLVSKVRDGLLTAGIAKGDRVAACLPNCIEAIVAMLATTSIGAVWSSCSPDFGANGVVDRFGQIRPRILFTADGYCYGGKVLDSLPNAAAIRRRIPSIQQLIVVPFLAAGPLSRLPDRATWFDDFGIPGATLEFEPVAFDHPLFILFSSGTTGVPKCIVHGHGGTLLQHIKEHRLHTDISSDDRLFYFSTCGWMMWNWLASGLASGSTLVLYDGSPFANDGHVLWQLAEETSTTVFGTSARYLSAQQKAGIQPREQHDLSSLRAVLSTGSPLLPGSFDYVYDVIADDIQLSSIAGGTDILGCFVLGNPLLPVRRGEIQCAGLGMDVRVFNDNGQRVFDEPGELVCCTPFPSAPTGFWGDDDNRRYQAAYFERFPGMWAHGDFATETTDGGFIISGRSDAVLNPGGVRIGTAEIYRQVERLDAIVDSIVVAQNWKDDVRVVLFVVLRENAELDDTLHEQIRETIRANTSPRHVPAKIIAVPDIPRTRSGKLVEIAVRDVIHGREVRNTQALANAAALDAFRNIDELQFD